MAKPPFLLGTLESDVGPPLQLQSAADRAQASGLADVAGPSSGSHQGGASPSATRASYGVRVGLLNPSPQSIASLGHATWPPRPVPPSGKLCLDGAHRSPFCPYRPPGLPHMTSRQVSRAAVGQAHSLPPLHACHNVSHPPTLGSKRLGTLDDSMCYTARSGLVVRVKAALSKIEKASPPHLNIAVRGFSAILQDPVACQTKE